MSSGQQPLCVHRLRVTFKNEPGEGSGVVRSFFTAVAEVLTLQFIHISNNYWLHVLSMYMYM